MLTSCGDCWFQAADVNITGGEHGTPLLAAVLGGHQDVVAVLIEYDINVNPTPREKHYSTSPHPSPLYLAVHNNRHDIAKALLDSGADVNIFLKNHLRIIIEACQNEDLEMVKLLLASGADVNLSREKAFDHRYMPGDRYMPGGEASALHTSCQKGHLGIVRELLANGADLETSVKNSGTPLHVAARAGQSAIVGLLLEAGAKVNGDSSGTPLSAASHEGYTDIVYELVSAGASIGGAPSSAGYPYTSNALKAACTERRIPVIKYLVERLYGTTEADSIYADAMTAVCEKGHDDVLHLLLSHGALPYPELINKACEAGLVQSVRTLLEQGTASNDSNHGDGRLLHLAACHQREALVLVLLEYGVDVNIRDQKYGSALTAVLEGYLAAFLGNLPRWKTGLTPKSADKLIALPSKKPEKDEAYESLVEALPRTPAFKYHRPDLYVAKVVPPRKTPEEVCRRIVKSLIDNGACVNDEVRGFGSALHLASIMGIEAITRLLVDHGAEVNLVGGYFGTPLQAAHAFGHEAVAEMLLVHGTRANDSTGGARSM